MKRLLELVFNILDWSVAGFIGAPMLAIEMIIRAIIRKERHPDNTITNSIITPVSDCLCDMRANLCKS